jgi:hypothetical protein
VVNKHISKDALHMIKKKTGKSILEKDIKKIASGVRPSTVQSDSQLKELIKQVSGLVNVKVSEQSTNDIIHAIKSSKIDANNLQQLMGMMMGKK